LRYYHAVTKVELISGNADDALHDVKTIVIRRKKYDDVATPDLAAGQQRRKPTRYQRGLRAVHEHVIANQQRVLHST
jgi:hypothetical protein